MIQKTLTVTNRLGLHARAAARLVSLTGRFQSRISMRRADRLEEIDGKSILGILMMSASTGTALVFTVEGPDEDAAIQAVEALFDRKFDEEGSAS